MELMLWKETGDKKLNSSPPQVRCVWVRTSARVPPCGRHTHASTRGRIWVHVCASIMYIYHHWEVKSHYETDASQALGEVCLIGLTETHQQVSTLPHKHTHRFASHFTVILHISDLRFHILCQIWHQGSASERDHKKLNGKSTPMLMCFHIYSPFLSFSKIVNVPLGHSSAIKLTSNYCFYYELICQLFYDCLFSRLIA